MFQRRPALDASSPPLSPRGRGGATHRSSQSFDESMSPSNRGGRPPSFANRPVALNANDDELTPPITTTLLQSPSETVELRRNSIRAALHVGAGGKAKSAATSPVAAAARPTTFPPAMNSIGVATSSQMRNAMSQPQAPGSRRNSLFNRVFAAGRAKPQPQPYLANGAGTKSPEPETQSARLQSHAAVGVSGSGMPSASNSPSPSPPLSNSSSFSTTAPQYEPMSAWCLASAQAQWISDNSVRRCMRCQKEFNFLHRRHHCRQCGDLCCTDCSDYRAYAKGYMIPQRVCARCHAFLSNVFLVRTGTPDLRAAIAYMESERRKPRASSVSGIFNGIGLGVNQTPEKYIQQKTESKQSTATSSASAPPKSVASIVSALFSNSSPETKGTGRSPAKSLALPKTHQRKRSKDDLMGSGHVATMKAKFGNSNTLQRPLPASLSFSAAKLYESSPSSQSTKFKELAAIFSQSPPSNSPAVSPAAGNFRSNSRTFQIGILARSPSPFNSPSATPVATPTVPASALPAATMPSAGTVRAPPSSLLSSTSSASSFAVSSSSAALASSVTQAAQKDALTRVEESANGSSVSTLFNPIIAHAPHHYPVSRLIKVSTLPSRVSVLATLSASLAEKKAAAAAKDMKKLIEHLSAAELFNRLSGFGSLLVLDSRSSEEYMSSHVPRSINVPVAQHEIDNAVSVEHLEAKVALGDRRTFKLRQRANVVIIGQVNPDMLPPKGSDGTSGMNGIAKPAQNDSADKTHMFANETYYLAELLLAEGRILSISIVDGGFSSFQEKYPFVCCGFNSRERACGKHMHRPPFPWYPNEILDDFMFLGSHVDAKNALHLRELKVTHILNVSNEVEAPPSSEFVFQRIAILDEDTVDIAAHFNHAFEFIDSCESAKGRILIHCHQGISRSATVVLGYLMSRSNQHLKDAFDFVRSRRKQIMPNPSFWRQLATVESKLFPGQETTMHLCVDIDAMQKELDDKKRKAEEWKQQQQAEKEEEVDDEDDADGDDEDDDDDDDDDEKADRHRKREDTVLRPGQSVAPEESEDDDLDEHASASESDSHSSQSTPASRSQSHSQSNSQPNSQVDSMSPSQSETLSQSESQLQVQAQSKTHSSRKKSDEENEAELAQKRKDREEDGADRIALASPVSLVGPTMRAAAVRPWATMKLNRAWKKNAEDS